MTYSDFLKSPFWQRKRLEIFQRDNFTCLLCEDQETTLNVHHSEYINFKKPWESENNTLFTYCDHCHEVVELLKGIKNQPLPFYVLKKKHEDNFELFALFLDKHGYYIHYCKKRNTGKLEYCGLIDESDLLKISEKFKLHKENKLCKNNHTFPSI